MRISNQKTLLSNINNVYLKIDITCIIIHKLIILIKILLLNNRIWKCKVYTGIWRWLMKITRIRLHQMFANIRFHERRIDVLGLENIIENVYAQWKITTIELRSLQEIIFWILVSIFSAMEFNAFRFQFLWWFQLHIPKGKIYVQWKWCYYNIK